MTIDINGFTNKVDILVSIKEKVEEGQIDTATDMLNQLIDVECKENNVYVAEKEHIADALDHHQIMQKGIVR